LGIIFVRGARPEVRAAQALDWHLTNARLQFDRLEPHFSLGGFEYGNRVCTSSPERIPCRRRAIVQHRPGNAALFRPASLQRVGARQRFIPAILSAGVSRPKRSTDHDGDRAKNGAHDGRGQRIGRATGKSGHGRALDGAGRPAQSDGLHHAERFGAGAANSSGDGRQPDENHGIPFSG